MKPSILQGAGQLQYDSPIHSEDSGQTFLMRRRISALACVAAALVTAAGCSDKAATEPAVATPSLTLNHQKVPIGSPVKLTYKFEVAPNASFDGDYWVFVHVLDPEGEQLWTDDHRPPTPTSAWKPGSTVEYTRTIFVPTYPYIGEAIVRLGLYKDDRRLTLNGTEASRKEYEVARFQLQPQSENIFRIYKDGWHPAETASDGAGTEWQWTQKQATLSFRNPRKDVLFYLESDARADLFTPPQQVTIRVGDQVIGTFAADSSDKKLQVFPVSAAQLGTGETAEVVIELDRIFVPKGGGDTRELGIRVFNAFIDPR